MFLIPFDFTLHQKVIIKAIETPGTIVGLILEDAGKSYRVCYWLGGGRYMEWVFANEIEPFL